MLNIKTTLSLLLSSLIILILPFHLSTVNYNLALAQSLTWKKHEQNPLTPLSWNAKTPFILQNGNDFNMYFTAPYNNGLSISVATSSSGLNWQIIQEDIIFPMPDADVNWKETRVANPTVIKNGNMYQIWYDSNILGSKNFKPGESRFRIQYATSNNGLDWDRKGVAIKPELSWEAEGVSGAMVIYSASQYHMWYAGRDKFGVWRIGYATSSNGENWNKHPNNPVLEATEAWEYANSTIPTVALPSVIEGNGTYTMFYSVGPQVPGYAIGYAVSDNGITWSKPDNNPLLSRDANSFDSQQIDSPHVITKDNSLYLYYAGHNGTNWSIGLATMELPTPTPSPTPTAIPTPTPTNTPTPTSTPTPTPTPLTTPTPTPTPTTAPTPTPTPTSTSTPSPTLTPTPILTPTPTPKEKDVIVIVPGMFASYDAKAFATCSKTPWQDWKLIQQVSDYNGLIKTLGTAGYIRNEDLFLFPYDWRQKITDSGKDLKEFINSQVVPKNPGKKIDLIGHSLGGLVARSYLQEYDNLLVDQLITVGSPHHGILEAYKPWAGGELPSEGSMRTAAFLLVNICKIRTASLTNKSAIRKSAPVFKDLLPVYYEVIGEESYLRGNLTQLYISNSSLQEDDLLNTYLTSDFNNGFSSYFSRFDSLSSTSKQMPLVFDVSPPSFEELLLGIYKFGTPVNARIWEKGDGTVLRVSATFNNDQSHDLPYDHRGLIYSENAIKKIAEVLRLSPSIVIPGQPTIFTPSLIMLLRSPATLTVKNPVGQEIVKDEKFVFIPDFSQGSYEVEVKGTDSGTYELTIGQLSEKNDHWQTFKRTTKTDQKDTYNFILNPAKPNLVQLTDTTASAYLLSAKEKIKDLQQIKSSTNLERALEIIDRIQFLADNSLNSVAGYYTRNLIRYLIYYKHGTDDVEAKNTALDVINNLESAFVNLAKNSDFDSLRGSRLYTITQQYDELTKTELKNNAQLNKATVADAAAYQQGNEKLSEAKQALDDNEPFKTEIQSWTAFYLFKEIR